MNTAGLFGGVFLFCVGRSHSESVTLDQNSHFPSNSYLSPWYYDCNAGKILFKPHYPETEEKELKREEESKFLSKSGTRLT